MDILDQGIGKLARSMPGVTAVFHKYPLDFCCGGNQTVRTIAREKMVDEGVLAAELARFRPGRAGPAQVSSRPGAVR